MHCDWPTVVAGFDSRSRGSGSHSGGSERSPPSQGSLLFVHRASASHPAKPLLSQLLDYTPARDPASGMRTGPDVRADPDVRAVPDVAVAASDAAHVHGGALHVAHMQDPSSMTQSSPSVAAATLGTDVRSRPRVNQSGP